MPSRLFWMAVLAVGTLGAMLAAKSFLGPEGYTGGSDFGITMGRLGSFTMFMSFAYAMRKQWLYKRAFTLEQWLYAHVVIGIVSLAFIIAHSGFKMQNDVAALALLFLTLTVLSGVAGLFIMYYKPRAQARDEATVLIPDYLCKRISRLHEEISELCSEEGEIFLRVYNELVIPLYRTEVGKDPVEADVSPWAEGLDPEKSEKFMRLAVKIEEAHDLFVLLGRHARFRWWIQAWLLFHVPSTIGLVVFSFVHIISIEWFRVS